MTLMNIDICQSLHLKRRYASYSLARYTNISLAVDFCRLNTFGSAVACSRTIIYSDVAADQALDTGFYVVHSRLYSNLLHDSVPRLIVANFQARYSGLCFVTYVYPF